MKNFVLLALALCATFAAINNVRSAPSELSAPAVAAYDGLHDAGVFALGGVGFNGTTSPGETAFRELQREPNAAAIFIALLDDETTTKAGQLYALLGLKRAEDAQFEARLPAFLADESSVTQFSGCIMMPVKAKTVAAGFVEVKTSDRT